MRVRGGERHLDVRQLSRRDRRGCGRRAHRRGRLRRSARLRSRDMHNYALRMAHRRDDDARCRRSSRKHDARLRGAHHLGARSRPQEALPRRGRQRDPHRLRAGGAAGGAPAKVSGAAASSVPRPCAKTAAPATAPTRSSAAINRSIPLMLSPLVPTTSLERGIGRRPSGLEHRSEMRGHAVGSFKVKLVVYFLLLSLLPIAAAFWGFTSVAGQSETRRVDARLQAGLRATLASYQERLDAAQREAASLARSRAFQRELERRDLLGDRARAPGRRHVSVTGVDGFVVGRGPASRRRARRRRHAQGLHRHRHRLRAVRRSRSSTRSARTPGSRGPTRS